MRPKDLHPLFAALPGGFAAAFDPDAPWALLGEPLEAALAALPSADLRAAVGPEVHLLGDRIAIGEGTRILPGAVILGPARIGRDVEIRPGAFLRGGVWIGDGCVVGANTEVKHAILLDGARAPHLNYVGDSILGSGVNLGAGTILSNFRFDGRPVAVPADGGKIATGLRKLGAILGDRSQTGCNCVLHPGVVVGTDTVIYPGALLAPGIYPARRVLKLRQELRPAPLREAPGT